MYSMCLRALVRVVTPMVSEKMAERENHTKQTVECAWFGDYTGLCAWEDTVEGELLLPDR